MLFLQTSKEIPAQGREDKEKCMCMMKRKPGFTLMEVCVAIAVLAVGVVVFGRYLDGFNRLRSLEREHARAVLETANAVEHFVQNPPACRDTVFAFDTPAARNQTPAAGSSKPAAIQVTLKTIPGPKPIAWLSACVVTPSQRTPSKAPVLRRLIWCVKD